MMRMEYSETGVFEDLQTQTVLNREFPVPEYSVTQSDDHLEIETEAFHMIYDKKKFSEEGLFIDVKYDFTKAFVLFAIATKAPISTPIAFP